MLWLKAFHLIFMVTWFAGLFYLPRLFVYHAMSDDHISDERFKVMERKLYALMTIGGLLTLVFGVGMLLTYAWQAYGGMGWLWAKLVLLAALVAYHLYCGKIVRDFRDGRNRRNHVYYRWFNEVPVPVLIAIVLLAVLKPF